MEHYKKTKTRNLEQQSKEKNTECISWTKRNFCEGALSETYAIKQYTFMAFASSYVQLECLKCLQMWNRR